MKSAWAIRHVAFEDLGVLAPLLVARGYDVRYLDAQATDFARIDPMAPDLLIVLGGPMGARETHAYPFLAWEADAMRRRRAADRPSLGICLGAQVLAVSAGGDVQAMAHKEIGIAPLQLTDAGRRSCLAPLADAAVLHWHGDRILLPEGIASLARTEMCETQAFELPGHALGLQFHLEADLARISAWTHGHARELVQAGLQGDAIEQVALRQAQALHTLAERVFGRWLDTLPH